VAKDGPLKWFQVAGADRKFLDAEAKIDGDTIVVSRPTSPFRKPCATPGITIPRAPTCTTPPACPPRSSAPMRGEAENRPYISLRAAFSMRPSAAGAAWSKVTFSTSIST